MKHTFTLLLLVFYVCLAQGQNRVIVKKSPSWVEYQDYDANPTVDVDEISQGSLVLLADYQVNIPKQEEYFRLVNKITDNVGIQSASNINAIYDPLYQKLTFHTIQIVRDGTVINKLNANDFQVIRRELNAENYLYDGSLSAMLNLSDVRNGDIIDFSYTIKGFNPIHQGRFSKTYYMNDYVPIGKINVCVNSKNPLNFKTLNTELKPKIKSNNGLKSYQWQTFNPEKFDYEELIPQWKMLLPTIIVSDYKSWDKTVKWGLNLYKVNTNLNSELTAKINAIDSEHKSQGGKIKAVLNFVQNDIRYLGIENGIGSYKPNPPNKVFDQRYGDCKDKSLLMVTMLNKMGVEAYPMLANTSLKETIKDLLPSPTFFDHCVVKVIDKANNELYYDPTLFNQGGTYKNVHFPNYNYGLVLKENNTEFDEIISSSDNKITTWEEFNLESENQGASLKITTTYSDVEADNMRNYFVNNSISSITKEYEKFYTAYYPKIKTLEQPKIVDDEEKNQFTTIESYAIDSIWQPMRLKPNYLAIDFVPTSLVNLLQAPNIESRKNEVQLPYPVSRQHNIKIKLPHDWKIEKDNGLVSSDAFYYDWEVKHSKKDNEVLVKYYLKIQEPSVKVEQLKKYMQDIKEVETSFGYSIFTPKNSLGSSSFSSSVSSVSSPVTRVVFGIIILAIIFIAVWFFSRKKESS